MKLIDKDALVAEIGRLEKKNNESENVYDFGTEHALKSILSFLDTLEVKEVDIKTELGKYFCACYHNKDYNIAKHFFELGLQARIDKELVEEVYSHIDSIKDTTDRMTSGNFMHNRAAIKFSANTIAKVLELIGFKAQKGE